MLVKQSLSKMLMTPTDPPVWELPGGGLGVRPPVNVYNPLGVFVQC